MIDYSKHIKKQNIPNTKDIKEKDYTIETMTKKIEKLNLEKQLENLMKLLTDFKEKMHSICYKFCRALGHKIGIHYNKNDEIDYDEMEMYANKINCNYALKTNQMILKLEDRHY